MALTIIAIIVGLLVLYAAVGRKWLKKQTWTVTFFSWIEPIEIRLWRKSETILMSRLMSIGSAVLTVHDSIAVFASSLDWTPVTGRILAAVPPDLRTLVVSGALAVFGYGIEHLRKATTKPLELVELPEVMEPKVAAAVAAAEASKEKAVAVVETAAAQKAEGA